MPRVFQAHLSFFAVTGSNGFLVRFPTILKRAKGFPHTEALSAPLIRWGCMDQLSSHRLSGLDSNRTAATIP